jgi:hypothetical protein
MPMGIKVAFSLYKLAHDSIYLQWNELFVIRKSNVHLILFKFVHMMNHFFKNQIWWPWGDSVSNVMEGFKELSSLLGI